MREWGSATEHASMSGVRREPSRRAGRPSTVRPAREEVAPRMKPRKTIPAKELFELDPNSSVPIWLQLKNRFIYLITSGYYLPGDQLPTVRGLAADVEINYNTVSKVYQSLEEDGYIQSKHRQGAFVCDVSAKPGVSIAVTVEIVTAEYLQRCVELGMSLEDIEDQFARSVSKEKAKRNKNQGAVHEQKEAGGICGHVVKFPGAAPEPEQRIGGIGA